jgi:Raf kinase inhibitor-like YbhB/YbcL family protein
MSFIAAENKGATMKQLAVIAVLMTTIGAVAQTPAAPPPMTKPGMTLTTTAFDDGGVIPNKYTQAAENGAAVSPKLTWTNVPDGVVSFALILHDPDTSLNKTTEEVLHWMVFNVPGTARELPEGMPAQAQMPDGSIQTLNRGKKVGYMGMGARAPGPYHHYTYELFALDTKLSLGADATQADVLKAMDGHILAKAVLEGRFHRP